MYCIYSSHLSPFPFSYFLPESSALSGFLVAPSPAFPSIIPPLSLPPTHTHSSFPCSPCLSSTSAHPSPTPPSSSALHPAVSPFHPFIKSPPLCLSLRAHPDLFLPLACVNSALALSASHLPRSPRLSPLQPSIYLTVSSLRLLIYCCWKLLSLSLLVSICSGLRFCLYYERHLRDDSITCLLTAG